MRYDCIIIGGGIAGLQAAIQLGRYKRTILTIDSGDGRSTLCRNYKNILGFPNGISGQSLRAAGVQQAKQYGVEFFQDTVTHLHKIEDGFKVNTFKNKTFQAKTILLATGVKDNIPKIPGIRPCLGLSIYVCPDCDGYEISNQKTVVMGSGDVGASMALTLLFWSSDITYINHNGKDLSSKWLQRLQENNILVDTSEIKQVLHEDGEFYGVETTDGRKILGEKSFVAFGGNHVRSELALQLGAQSLKNNHLYVDPKTKMTSVKNVWAAGDTVAHSELVTAAMGDGSLAAIWIHKTLMSV
ncbi:NAD(P)/FAD-dependent oxidoreductase [Pseudalkalibacillus hwajinpoensis]|uniref:NAD(P)/FAD-dependent oxidoreductase n=1 Tax=Guptibacillus hwajinpoensis TaxID=208199 RepID=UPI00325A882B